MSMGIRQTIRLSTHPAARVARSLYALPGRVSIPAPAPLARPVLFAFQAARSLLHFGRRVLIAEPLFKAHCRSYGPRLHTGIFVHWIQGKGEIILGSDVRFDGKSSFKFASRYSPNPTLKVGNHTGIGHGCTFTVGKHITIGDHCRIASGVTLFDSPGHPLEPEARRNGLPAADEDVRPISIGNNVWIGSNSVIFPGVIIGDNSVVAMNSSVMINVPPDTVVGGNPARSMKSLVKVSNA
jgi:acetyltransferase-like isoleucine patch superfamily enzyme